MGEHSIARKLTIDLHELFLPLVIVTSIVVDIIARVHASVRASLGLDLLANEVTEPNCDIVSRMREILVGKWENILVVEIIHLAVG